MLNFRVWAPHARKAEIKINDQILPMKKIDEWWHYESDLNDDVNYGYIIDGRGPCPDPRSNFQPNGVHGLSRTFEHNLFNWTDNDWQSPPLSSGVIYELHTGTFTTEGTFEAIIDKIDYLKELGITHIELMPPVEFSGKRGWGYDGVNLFAPHHAYGGPYGLKKLINACHDKQLGVIIDVVYNHLGPEGNYLDAFGPYFTKKYHTFWGSAFNYDTTYSNEVRNFAVDNCLMWFRDYHADGLRLDAIHAIYDQSAIHILEQIASEVKKLEIQLGRKLYLIAESDLNNPRVIHSPDIGGYGFDAQWSDDFHHALHSVMTGETNGYYEDFGHITDIAKSLQKVFVYDGIYSKYRKAIHGRPAEKCEGSNFLGYIQNHDQVGNRAAGQRIGHLVSQGKAKIAACIVLTSPYIPMLFQGEEFNASSPFLFFTNVSDAGLGKAITEGRKREFAEFGWKADKIPDPQSVDTFLKSKLKWEEIKDEPHKSMLEWYKSLIQLRKTHPELKNGNFKDTEVSLDESRQWIKITRGHIIIIANFASNSQQVPLENGDILLKSEDDIEVKGTNINMPGESAVILNSLRSG